MTRLESAGRRHHQSGKQASFSPSRSTHDCAYGRECRPCEPSTRRNATADVCSSLVENESALLDFRDRIRRRRFDPVDLAGENAACGFAPASAANSILSTLGTRACPIIFVLRKLQPLAGREARTFPWAGAGDHGRTAPSAATSPWHPAFGCVEELFHSQGSP